MVLIVFKKHKVVRNTRQIIKLFHTYSQIHEVFAQKFVILDLNSISSDNSINRKYILLKVEQI